MPFDNKLLEEVQKSCCHSLSPRGRGLGRGGDKLNQVTFAKNLRKRSTDTEKRLWLHLRAKRFDGLKFRRQEPIGKYIVDFVCYEKLVIIECDGSQHIANSQKDQIRDRWFEDQGYRILRFWDYEILQNIDEVLEKIYQVCKLVTLPPTPSHRGRGEYKTKI